MPDKSKLLPSQAKELLCIAASKRQAGYIEDDEEGTYTSEK